MPCGSSTLYLLLIVIIHQSQGENLQENSERNTDLLTCYKSVTLELFGNLKNILQRPYGQIAENEFKSSVESRLKTLSLLLSNEKRLDDLVFRRKLQEMERTAEIGFIFISRRLKFSCTDEKQNQLLKYIANFKEHKAKCGDHDYLTNSPMILVLEKTCPQRGTKGYAENEPSSRLAEWKNSGYVDQVSKELKNKVQLLNN
ncbi:uncharacterized protein LOC135848320 [Planococcus citri]|uniref:uncharacterized protein LOC135848320 n=1 Tax=Planococcus citri TaxID=170843 RepID=UPI0031F8B3CB